MTQTSTREMVILGGGCFWCLEAVFDELRGVEDVVSGYAGGHVLNPSYEQVCSDTTGHAEVVQITFDSSVVSFKELLEVFFTIHDPTTLNQQGHDIGSQYRSAIFYSNEDQQKVAEETIAELTEAKLWPRSIVTQVMPLPVFYPAEDYHQEYFKNYPSQGYCQAVIVPKLVKARTHFLEKLKK